MKVKYPPDSFEPAGAACDRTASSISLPATSYFSMKSLLGISASLRNFTVADLVVRAGGAILGSGYGVAGMAAGFSLATLLISVPLMAWIGGLSACPRSACG